MVKDILNGWRAIGRQGFVVGRRHGLDGVVVMTALVVFIAASLRQLLCRGSLEPAHAFFLLNCGNGSVKL
jgi:hypothetical protein